MTAEDVRAGGPAIACLGDRCCGCGACAAVCRAQCIVMVEDACGFMRPQVDAETCWHCETCDTACPVLGRGHAGSGVSEERICAPTAVDGCDAWWVQARDADLVARSSSGGVFALLAEAVARNGGAVYGAAFAEGCRSVRHERATSSDGMAGFMRSKYVQSVVGVDIYQGIAIDLARGHPVLFSGTACQVAGVRRYLASRNISDEGLTCVDVICHGAPSPRVWRAWLDDVESRLGEPVVAVDFRDKRSGWEDYSVTYRSAGGREVSRPWNKDWFIAAFLNNASLRPSCSGCPFKCDCDSDLTLGDFWGIRTAHPEVEVEQGISAVIVRTEMGARTFESIAGEVRRGRSDIKAISAGNPSLRTPAKPYVKYDEFMRGIAAGYGARDLRRRWGFGLTLADKLRRRLGRE